MINQELIEKHFRGNEELKKRFLSSFIEHTFQDLEALKAAVEQKQTEAARYLAHKIHSSMKSLGTTYESVQNFKTLEEHLVDTSRTEYCPDILRTINLGFEIVKDAESMLNDLKS